MSDDVVKGEFQHRPYFSYSNRSNGGLPGKFHFDWREQTGSGLSDSVRVIQIADNSPYPEAVAFRYKSQKLAVKILKSQRLLTVNEEKALLSRRHSNLVEYLLYGEIMNGPDNESFINPVASILMAYYPGGNLNSLATEHFLTEWEICWFMRQVANGLAYLHAAMAHGDIKGAKIFLTDDRLSCRIGENWKLDSSTDRTISRRRYQVNSGSVWHMSPEMLINIFGDMNTTNFSTNIGRAVGTPFNRIEKPIRVERASDIWSFGCLALEMFNKGVVQYVSSKGKPLQLDFNNNSRDPPAGLQLLQHVKKGAHPDLSSTDSQRMSAPLKDIVKHCLSSKSADRPVATELAVALENLMNRAHLPSQPHLIYSTVDPCEEGLKLYFRAKKHIGQGSFGDVYAIEFTDNNDPQKVTFTHRNNQLALKVLRWGKLDIMHKTALLSLDHPNIVRYICSGILPIDLQFGRPYPSPPTAVLMEYYSGGDLNKLAKHENLNNEDILRYLRQIADGLSYLHARQFSSQQREPIIHAGRPNAAELASALSKGIVAD
ncbi:hypothetical protein BV898_05453 [Hypsibius exemplaris]|uniref:Protein kinase domain-containing protein n=1 Tax=Hypsibius exemplaris TaxID=2072580 RepID=A0A1W0WZI8_HYPEX|nr:hypothetical protein BV898_05453 [Hypsibius exemplaris]